MKKTTLRADGTRRVVTINDKPSKTDQSFKKECDVNEIMRKFLKTGQVTHLAKRAGQFADVSEIQDLHNSMIQVTKAQALFDSLPALLRRKFGNSPISMMEYLADSSNDEEAIKLGLKVPSPTLGADDNPPETKPVLGRGSPSNKKTQKKPTLRNDDLNDDNPE